ncbi:MAG: cytosolic protein [Leptospiraceae bacterium]|nr:cytosolic protein [Leptospiraceae bacterium]
MKTIEQDIPWKEVLEIYFKDFVAFFLPKLLPRVNWKQKPVFLDKEFQKLTGGLKDNKKILDKLIRVRLISGEIEVILIHIEIQGSYEKDFAERMLIYYLRIYEKYRCPITSIAILTDERKSWKPSKVEIKSPCTTLSFNYQVCKLLDYQKEWDKLVANRNIFSVVVMSHLKALETRRHAQDRLRWKIELVKLLYERGYKRNEIFHLFHFINRVLVLPVEMERSFEKKLKYYEEKKEMPYVSLFERSLTAKITERVEKEITPKLRKEITPKLRKEITPKLRKEITEKFKREVTPKVLKQGLSQGLLDGIQLALELKFNDKGLRLYKSVSKVRDIPFLRSFMQEIKKAKDVKELKEFIKEYKQKSVK